MGGIEGELDRTLRGRRLIDTDDHRATRILHGLVGDNRDGAMRVCGDSVRDTAQQLHRHRRALTAGSDHDEESILGGLRKHVRRVPLDDSAFDLEIGVPFLQTVDHLFETLASTLPVLFDVIGACRKCFGRMGAARNRYFGDYIEHQQWDPPCPRTLGGPINSLVSALRTIGSYDESACGL